MFRKMNLSSNKISSLAHLLEFDCERKDNEPDLPGSTLISQEMSERLRVLQSNSPTGKPVTVVHMFSFLSSPAYRR